MIRAILNAVHVVSNPMYPMASNRYFPMAQITGSQLSLFEYLSPFQEIIKVETKLHCTV